MKWESRKRLTGQGDAYGLMKYKRTMRSLSRITDDRNERAQAIGRKIDAFFEAGRDLAREIAITWLETQRDQAVERETRAGAVEVVREIAPAPGGEPLMTAVELGDYLKIEAQTLRDWARKGRIPCEYANSEIRFRRSVIDQWLTPGQLDKSEEKVENAPIQNDAVVKSDRSFLRPQRSRRKSNGRV